MAGPGSGRYTSFVASRPTLAGLFKNKPTITLSGCVEKWNALLKVDLGKGEIADKALANVSDGGENAMTYWNFTEFSYNYGEHPKNPNYTPPDNDDKAVIYHPHIESPGADTRIDLGSTSTENITVNIPENENYLPPKPYRKLTPEQPNPQINSTRVANYIGVGINYKKDDTNFELFGPQSPT